MAPIGVKLNGPRCVRDADEVDDEDDFDDGEVLLVLPRAWPHVTAVTPVGWVFSLMSSGPPHTYDAPPWGVRRTCGSQTTSS